MARLTSSKCGGANSRYVDEFDRPIGSVGYSAWAEGDVTLGLSFNAIHDGKPETGKNKDRNYTLRLDTAEVSKIVGSLFSPNYSLGFFTTGHSDQLSDRLANKVMEANGLFAERYRVPWQNKDGWLYVMGLNIKHAIFQLQRLMKDRFNPDQLEVELNGQWVPCNTKELI